MLFGTIHQISILIAADVHLRADTINLGYAIGLPLLNPVDETLHLLVVIPIRLQVVVVDKELHILRAIRTSQATSLTYVFQVAHVVLPIEIITTYIPCSIGITTWVVSCRVLQQIVTLTVVTATRDCLVHKVPSLYLTVAGFHHTLNPLVHCIHQCVVHLFLGQRNSSSFVTLELDVLDIDITYKVTTLQHKEAALHNTLIFYCHVLPFGSKGNIRIFSIAPVTQLTV